MSNSQKNQNRQASPSDADRISALEKALEDSRKENDERLRQFEEALKSANSERDEAVRRSEEVARQSDETKKSLKELESSLRTATQPGATMQPGGNGRMIDVKRGDIIAYDLRIGNETIRGGWRKAEPDEKCSGFVSRISVANKPFRYDEAVGAPYHAVNAANFKKWTQDGEKVVGDGEPTDGMPPKLNIGPPQDMYSRISPAGGIGVAG